MHSGTEFRTVRAMLIAENAYQRGLVLDLLRGLGLAGVQLAEDAVAGFAQLSMRPVDVAVVDAELTPHSGLQFAREVRAAKQPFRRTPIVLYTSELSPAFAEACESAGVTEVLPKPVSMQDLRTCLYNALAGPPQGSRLSDRIRDAAAVRSGRGTQIKAAAWGAEGALEREARTALLAALDETRIHVTLWSALGAAMELERARAAFARALAVAGGADQSLKGALSGARRLFDAPGIDPRAVETIVLAVRALALSGERPALRAAVAEAIAEAVQGKLQALQGSSRALG